MKCLFIVTSAIMSGSGNSQERFIQTLHTLDSIRSRIPNADIWILEGSNTGLEKNMHELLGPIRLFDFSKDDRIQDIMRLLDYYNPPFEQKEWIDFFKLGALKNLIESYMIRTALCKIDKDRYDFVFKLSGRYFLTEDFDINKLTHFGKITTARDTIAKDSESAIKFFGSEYSISCVSWCFCYTIIDEIKKSFSNIENYIFTQISSNLLGDIEHGLFMYIEEDIRITTDKFGIMGRVNNSSITKY